jgi:RNA polymerase sigma-70 factor (ECF subfamily)
MLLEFAHVAGSFAGGGSARPLWGANVGTRGFAVIVKRVLDADERAEAADAQAAAVEANQREDSELVRRCQAGDERAFERLFQRHRGSVTRLVHRMLGPSAELEDLVQEVFLQVLRSLHGFRDEARFSTWLYRVALNVVLMHRRASGRRPRLVDEAKGEPAVDRAPSAHEALETRRRVAAFHALLARLSEKKRTVFVLHELEGLTPVRISEIVGAPVLTVRTRLFYARRELERWIAEEPSLAGFAQASGEGSESEEEAP